MTPGKKAWAKPVQSAGGLGATLVGQRQGRDFVCFSRGGASSQLTLFDIQPPPDIQAQSNGATNDEVRQLVPARDDLRPLYLNTQGLRAGVSGKVLKIKQKDKVVQEPRLADISQLNLFGGVQLTTQSIQRL